MNEIVLRQSWYVVMAVGVLFFSALYFGVGGINFLLSRRIFPAIGYGHVLDRRPVSAAQIRRELGLSGMSIFLFGAGLVFPWGLLKLGWAKLSSDATLWQICAEIVVLLIWNEVHFYLTHRLLHTRLLRRFHLPHHLSVVTTPWASYSFHPLETLMLGNVILLPMCMYDFSFTALLAVPVFSIVFNNIGHSNYDFLPDAKRDRWWLNGARRHHLHHACYHGNYGFMFPFMDRFFHTELKADAANIRLGATPNRTEARTRDAA